MVSAGRVQTMLTCAKAPERRAMLPDGFSVGCFRLVTRLGSARLDQYAHICIRPVRIACLRAVFVELIQSCRTDTDPIYSSVSDLLPKSSVAFLGTDLDQIGSIVSQARLSRGGESLPIRLLCCILSSRAPNEVGVNINWTCSERQDFP